MAETEETVFKSVQELANNNQVPENYIYAQGSINTSPPLLDVPKVDLSLLTFPNRQQELNKLQSSLKSCGCIQVINHGMEDSFIDKVREISEQFFALPTEEKQLIKWKDTEMIKFLQISKGLIGPIDYILNVFPEDIKKLQFWPQKPECFSVIERGGELLLDQCGGRGNMIARFNFYPPCPRPDVVLGVKQHADSSAITILLQDKEVEGLQVLKDDQWFRVPVVPYGLLINVGDQVEVMSNGIFKSPVHRVVMNAERERNTLAVFIMPDVDVGIGPVEKLINEERLRTYECCTLLPKLSAGEKTNRSSKDKPRISLAANKKLHFLLFYPTHVDVVCWFLLPLFVFLLVVVACDVYEPNTKIWTCSKKCKLLNMSKTTV